ncbi:hypothetical protein JCM19232_1590 [Vibrio ishigakensis]|uniref:Uncharacterized protein n=1 Tax=Vibrio ishigakensis TaxID=1481914 RepID=A0A0B8PSK9_9VIBR|nr:hypothetical protein JCM19232_1590 [Vibrio ishigakensis]
MAPVSLLIQTERAQALVADLKAREEFAIEVKEHNQQQLHFLLHPHTSHLK